MQREDMLAKVEAAYQARRTGDFTALGAVVCEDAAFSFAGEQSLLAALPGSIARERVAHVIALFIAVARAAPCDCTASWRATWRIVPSSLRTVARPTAAEGVEAG